MQEYKFDSKEYKKKILKKETFGFSFFVYVFVCIILMGVIFFLKPSIKTKTENFYYVEVACTLNYNEAFKISTDMQTKGGAGYIYFDGKYHVFANLYLTKLEANSVAENIKEVYPSSKIYEMEFNKNINTKQLSSQQEKAVKNLTQTGFNSLNQIYENIIEYDKANLEKNIMILNFKTIKNNFESCYNEFIAAFDKNSKFNKCKTHLEKLYSSLENLTKDENQPFNYKYELINFSINFLSVLTCF